ncbi:MAG: uracil-DNA glycosylase family protein [Bifidobacterium sp.]|uniref:Uracil-DNA glycosylase family protein n=1 Tax=Bifidobacterium fermentum TaxID=3059035 RepID=A0AB39UA43_9BIFI
MNEYEHVEHGFGPICDAQSEILILGSMPSPKSRAAGFYYMHPRNRFWQVLDALYSTVESNTVESNTVGSKTVDSKTNGVNTNDIRTDAIKARESDGPRLPESSIAEKTAFLLAHRIALWDVLESCDIRGASDASIRNPVPNDIVGLIRHSRIHAVYATGRRAADLYRRYSEASLRDAEITVPLIALPSTSPANAAMSLPQLIEAYRCITFTEPTSGKP